MKKVVFFVIVASTYCLSSTNIGGIISTNTTFTELNSPYIVTSNLLVSNGVTLTIEEGVELRFNANLYLQIEGTLLAIGTSSEEITFTSNLVSKNEGDWYYLFFVSNSTDATFDGDDNYLNGSILKYCNILYAGGNNKGAIYVDNSAPYLNNCDISNSASNGIYEYKGFSRIEYCSIYNNGSRGIYFDQNPFQDIYVRNNIIYENTDAGIEFDSHYSEDIYVSSNTIRDNQNSGIITARDGGSGWGNYYFFSNNIHGNQSIIGAAIYFYASNNATIQYNNIYSNTADNAAGIYIHGRFNPYTYKILNNNINNNTAIESAAMLLNITPSGYPANIYITGNKIENNTNINTSDGSIINLLGYQSYLIYNDTYFYLNNNHIKSNTAYSTLFLSKFKGNINYNTIYNSTTYEVKNFNAAGTNDIDAKNNYWGTNVESEIEDLLYDKNDDFGVTFILYSPWSLIDNPLPVQMSDYIAYFSYGIGNTISWATQSEENCQGFLVLRSEFYDSEYIPITNQLIKGQGNTSVLSEYSMVDTEIEFDKEYFYKIQVKYYNEEEDSYFGPIRVITGKAPSEFSLFQNFPNPFNPYTEIKFEVFIVTDITLTVYDLLGREIITLFNGYKPPGFYSFIWDGTDESGYHVPSGIYLYKLISSDYIGTRKMIKLE